MDDQCQFCKEPIEDLSHTLYYCPNIKEWWPILLPFMNEARSIYLSFLELVLWVNKRGTTADFKKFFVIAWSL